MKRLILRLRGPRVAAIISVATIVACAGIATAHSPDTKQVTPEVERERHLVPVGAPSN
jgi:hypothetical protein